MDAATGAVEGGEMSRYIDADAFEANMENEWERNEISNGEWIHFREMINAEPTADVAPVVHGRWKRVGDTAWECSACGCISCCNGTYCPDCSAKMDGGEETTHE